MRGQLRPYQTTRLGQQLILVMSLLLAASGATAGQFNDRDSPTLPSSNTTKGAGVGKKVEYHYTNSGDCAIKLGGAVQQRTADSSARGVMPPPASLPDLIVKEISFEPAPSQIRVQVINRGNAPSSDCFLALQSLAAADDPSLGTKQRVWIIEIPALEAGKGFSKVINVSPLTQTSGRWKATVDRSNTVKESNESNNSLVFPPDSEGPSGPLPDLFIDHFELTNPSRGEVKIQVTNKGGGNAGKSTLRLIVWKPGKFEQKEAATAFANVPALASGQTTSIVVLAGLPIRRKKHSIYIDISEDVK